MALAKTISARTSGEWIASDWPVCAVADTTNPQRNPASAVAANHPILATSDSPSPLR
jgi:hypothetical protein